MFNWLTKFFEKRSLTAEQYPFLVAPRTSAGVPVNENTALNLSAVWCAVNTIAGELASLDCKLYREIDEEKEEAENHPLYDILLREPNFEMTPFVFFETMQSYLLRYGNCYAEIERDGTGRAVALWPLHPTLVLPERNEKGRITYRIQTQQVVFVQPEDMLHVPGLGNGFVGMGPVAIARESLGLSLGVEKYGAAFFGNAVRPSGVVKSVGRLSDQARANIRQSIEYANSQPANSARLMVLEEGLEFSPFSFNNEDYQFLETRRFQIEEIARWFQLSPTRLKELGRATWNNLATEYQDFYNTTLRHWAIKWEQEIERKLLSKRERSNYFVEFHFDSVLRADPETRFKIYQLGTQTGILEINECRARENLNPIEEEPQETEVDITPPEAPGEAASDGNESKPLVKASGEQE